MRPKLVVFCCQEGVHSVNVPVKPIETGCNVGEFVRDFIGFISGSYLDGMGCVVHVPGVSFGGEVADECQVRYFNLEVVAIG